MKNKTLKNLIGLIIFATFLFGANSLFAYQTSDYYNYNNSYGYNISYPIINNSLTRDNYSERHQLLQQQYNYAQQQLILKNQLAKQKYNYDREQMILDQNLLLQKQQAEQQKQLSSVQQTYSYNYTQPQTQYYLAQPTTIQYIPQQQTLQYLPEQNIQYIPSNSQGASVIGSTTYTNKVITKTTGNTGTTSNTGQYISYDANMLGASAYGYNGAYGYNNGQVLVDPSYDPNGVTALSINGSGGFLPSSIFQWFMFILLVLAIVIVARIIIKKRNAQNISHGAQAH